MAKYLDYTGLQTFWNKIKTYMGDELNSRDLVIAAALNDLNDRLDNFVIPDSTSALTTAEVDSVFN